MQIAVSEAKGLLLELVRRAEAGEEIVLTRHGKPVARLSGAVPAARTPEEILARVKEIQESASRHLTPGPCAARSQDFLYDENGLPR